MMMRFAFGCWVLLVVSISSGVALAAAYCTGLPCVPAVQNKVSTDENCGFSLYGGSCTGGTCTFSVVWVAGRCPYFLEPSGTECKTKQVLGFDVSVTNGPCFPKTPFGIPDPTKPSVRCECEYPVLIDPNDPGWKNHTDCWDQTCPNGWVG